MSLCKGVAGFGLPAGKHDPFDGDVLECKWALVVRIIGSAPKPDPPTMGSLFTDADLNAVAPSPADDEVTPRRGRYGHRR